ncbi:Mrp/NBP35 family ATP-binding protein [bacterium]|nr:Mrp/NBP35 family ATP-binding protein [bacterium]
MGSSTYKRRYEHLERQKIPQGLVSEELEKQLEKIKHRIIVLSGKGGVGKSTVALNLAVALSLQNKKVGLLDIDIHGPTIPKMIGWKGKEIEVNENGKLTPVQLGDNLKVMSIGFLLPDEDSSVIWRGPMKYRAIQQFLEDVEWGELDYLLIDSPPGTGDEPLSIVQLLGKLEGAIIVATPQQVAVSSVRKSITFCRKLNVPILGVVENMSGFICPYCGARIDIFSKGGAEKMAEEMKIPFLGRIPIDPHLVEISDAGQLLWNSGSHSQIRDIFEKIAVSLTENSQE